MEQRLGTRDVVLLGIGHTHAHLVKQWAMHPIPDVNLICVTDYLTATYSGMLPGVLAGDYAPEQMELDLVKLLSAAKVQWVQDELESVNRTANTLFFKSGRQVRYDLLSVGVGSRPQMVDLKSDETIPVISIKPMQSFLQRMEAGVRQVQQRRNARSKIRIDVVGGGLGSVEVIVCLRHFLRRCGWEPSDYRLRLISGSTEPPVGCLPKTRARIVRVFKDLEIELLPGAKLLAVDGDQLILDNGQREASDLVVYLAAGHASPVTELFDVPRDDRGCLLTNRRLESIQDPRIWAGGDCGSIQGLHVPKAGVYAVRQGPVMWGNLERWALGQPLQDYKPQHDFLKLINVGGQQAIGEWHGFSFQGRWVWKLKDYIDTNFMKMYQSLPEKMLAKMNSSGTTSTVMRCLGCGSKIGADGLRQVLADLQENSTELNRSSFATKNTSDDVVLVPCHDSTTASSSDLRASGQHSMAVSVDAFPSPVADPWLAGRLAVLHSLSDLWVSGIAPQHVLATVEIPFGSPTAQRHCLYQVMSGITHQLRLENATLVGGHSLEGPRLSVALTVLGASGSGLIPAPKQGLQPGDALIISKGLGTGVGLATLMQGQCPASVYQAMIESMLQANRIALDLIKKFPIHAMTDVTGFGLLGHLHEMVADDPVQIILEMQKVRAALFPGVWQLLEAGHRSTMHENNLYFLADVDRSPSVARPSLDKVPVDEAILLDPQSSGGILCAVPNSYAADVVSFLHQQQFEMATVIGQVQARAADSSRWCTLKS